MTSVPEAMKGENQPHTHPDTPRGGDSGKSNVETKTIQVKLDIEHAEVTDDPRLWSRGRKVSDITFCLMPAFLLDIYAGSMSWSL